MAFAVSYCIVNTNGREHLLRCLEAIRETNPPEMEAEVLVLDNASEDGSVDAARDWIADAGAGIETRLIELAERRGKAANDSHLLAEAAAPLCLLLNEDSELRPGATAALVAALEERPDAAVAGGQLLSPEGEPQPCAWRLPSSASVLAGVLFLHRALTVQSRGAEIREVGWVQSSAMLVRRDAARDVGYLDPDFFVYSDETDFEKRLTDAGWSILYVPAAQAVHHEQLASDRRAGSSRVVEFHRGRDLYLRKHHPRLATLARPLSSFPYLIRAALALILPGHDPGWYALHARQALRPSRGKGLREAASEYNSRPR